MVTMDTTKKAFGAVMTFIQPGVKSLGDRAGERLWSGFKGLFG